MRNLSPTIASAISGVITKPIFLVEMAFDPVQYYSTVDKPITWDSKTWGTGQALSVRSLSITPMGTATASLMIHNTNQLFTTEVLLYGVVNRAVKIYQYYDYGAGDAYLMLDGIMDAVEIDDENDNASVQCRSYTEFTEKAPRILIMPPRFKYAPRAGRSMIPAVDYPWWWPPKWPLI